MTTLRTILCAIFMVTVAMSKPVCLNGGEDSSKSSESSESNSSEETATHTEPPGTLQPAFPETDVPNAMEETDPPYSASPIPPADIGPSQATLDTNASPLPDPEDPQTSTDIDPLHLMPDTDPSHTSLGIDISRDMPDSDLSQDSINADIARVQPETGGSQQRVLTEADLGIDATDTNQTPLVTATYHVFPQGAAPSRSPDTINPTPPPLSAVPPQPIPVGTTDAISGVPVCFTLQFTTPEPSPPRGDSI